jgi:tRNA A-37 threonylcarbamoyl transferase component Bud32
VRAAFPHLEILELIGQGGMGAVFKARQPKLNRFVALKILPESMARDPSFAERLAREGQLLARLNHPNVVTVHDFGSANGFFYLLMEYVDGVNLRQAMQAGRFTAEQALAIVPMICDALQYAHDEGVLHRDIKPENILLDTKGRLKLADFGIAKLAARDDPTSTPPTADAPRDAAPQDIALTQSGNALGTPSYMAPEQRSSPSTVDSQADIYSLGVVFYEMLTGELPSRHVVPPSRKAPMDPRVDEVVLRALARHKEQRYRTAAEIRTSVQTITGSPLPTAASIPAAARAYPISIGRNLTNALTIGLLILFAFMLVQLRQLPALVLHQLAIFVQGDWLQRLIALVGTGGIAWLTLNVWKRRAWLHEPFQSLHDPTNPSATDHSVRPHHDHSTHWLSWAWSGVLGVWSVQLLWMLFGQVVSLAQSVHSLPRLPNSLGLSLLFFIDVLLFPALLPVILAVALVRRELRRPHVLTPAPPPAWMARAALLTVCYAIITTFPIQLVHSLSGSIAFATVSNGAFLIILVPALLTRSRVWRGIALAVLLVTLVSGSSGLCFIVALKSWTQRPDGWSHPLSESLEVSIMVGSQLLGLFCCAMGLMTLLLPSARAAFGLPPRRGGQLRKPSTAPARA